MDWIITIATGAKRVWIQDRGGSDGPAAPAMAVPLFGPHVYAIVNDSGHGCIKRQVCACARSLTITEQLDDTVLCRSLDSDRQRSILN